MITKGPNPASATIADVSLLSLNMESEQPETDGTSFTAEASVSLGDLKSKPTDDATVLSTSISIDAHATCNDTNKELLSIELEVGCTVIGDSSSPEETLWGLAIDAALGYARTLIHTLSVDSAAKEGLYIPLSSGSDLIRFVQEAQQDSE